ncbi:phage tail protein [Lysobacter helvus]|uniref:Phage tail protein n=2 Tax=Lysobacteraceae TaxID=32033 RepID=A0ABM7Q1D2_9GAMM|nr:MULTISPECIES: phage tail protein [Lysobacter]BCT91021.1 phage tail protein [Lysobacter caseinilyticus]BCT94174.1 phage tail protein [Lysobacter helvus]
MAKRQDPFRGFRYVVEMEGLVSGGFLRVKGLSREVRVESYKEGGVNEYEHKLASNVTYPNLVLERGLALDDLFKWAQAAADGQVQRRNLWIRLHDEANDNAWAWEVAQAIPVKWSASDLDATSQQVVMESLELAHHGLRKAT